ncbi:DUF342 domain-containing protein [Photobacterium sp. 1_MG-2023]|uniref:DUF342 domain-containing protein n=1 Tax=Photobacterium sp. 1_MG-2023 TaxID=3062646 RepID=UPI0026E31661|nr:FapA family protein [Photobacterium sp. 1_MG-2023]MDO6708231.1 FapA family protein [Photobacterium sp. 1_MG-2023]
MLDSLLTLEPEGAGLSLIVRKPETGDFPELDQTLIQDLLAQSPYHDFQIDDDAVEQVILFLSQPEMSGESAFRIAERKDVAVEIEISEDHMFAFVTLTGAFGGEKLSAQNLVSILKSHAIVRGVSKKRLQFLLQKSWELAPGERFSLKIAAGRPAIHGSDTQFEALVPDASTRILAPQDSDHGKVDMRDLGKQITVSAGQPLMRRTPPTLGQPGYDVHGKAVLPVAGKTIAFDVGIGVRVAEEDENLLIATRDGMPRHGTAGMAVDEVMTLNGVDVTTGHIDFNGAVLVYGDVSPGMKIQAAGNITITGVVELAELSAGGDITVASGVIGRMQDGKPVYCTLTAEGKVAARFAQYAHISSGGDTELHLHLAHSWVQAKGEVRVIDIAQRHGSITGGRIEADGGVRACVLGAEAGVETQIHLMGQFQALKAQIDETRIEIRAQEERLHQLVVLQMKMSKLPKEKRSPEYMTKLENGKAQLMATLAEMKALQQMLQAQYQQQMENARVEVSGLIHPGVHVRIEEKEFVIEQEIRSSVICLRDHQFVCQPIHTKHS